MERLRDLRVNLQLDVKVWGLDSSGKPFRHDAKTVEIGALGARLSGVLRVQVNDLIGVQHGDQKARFRVVWAGEPNTEQDGQVGVECMEPGRCIWTAALEGVQTRAVDTATPPSHEDSLPGLPGAQPWPAADRRRYPRYACTGTITLKQAGEEVLTAMRLSDLSLGGCYGETLSPLPVGANVELILKVGELQLAAKAVVRTRHASMGNGFAFTRISPEEWKLLADLVQQLGSGKVVSDTQRNPEMIDGLEALVAILQRKGVLSREEVVAELARRRSAR